MSVIREIFYNLFWQNKACQNLFLLSKEEFLDTKTITIESNTTSISFPRIILSNIQSKDEHLFEKVKLRTETHNIKTESIINNTFDRYAPILTNLLETKFGKSIQLFLADFEKDPWSMLLPIGMTLFNDENDFEKEVMDLLKKYEFIPKHINTFTEFENYFQREAISKNFKEVLSEQNLWNFFEILKSFKDMYVNEAYKSLYNSNQILVSSFHDIDNFEDRLKVFSILYENEIIKPSIEDSFIECTSCPPSTYKGVFHLKTDPVKLRDFKCPICNSLLTFYVPYELDKTIYEIVKSKDGLLLDALAEKLKRNKIEFVLNQKRLNDIELDCIYKAKGMIYVVESKMYKQNTKPQKLISKLKEHYSKLISDISRIQEEENGNIDVVMPILLVNINDSKLLNETLEELKKSNQNDLFQKGRIITINQIEI